MDSSSVVGDSGGGGERRTERKMVEVEGNEDESREWWRGVEGGGEWGKRERERGIGEGVGNVGGSGKSK